VSERIQRVNQLIKRELGPIILKEIEFPPGVLVTLTRVETSVGLKQAKIYVSAIPRIKLEIVLKILNHRIYLLQQKLNKRLRMRPLPKIMFVEEKETSEAGRIEEILEELKSGGK